METQQKVRRVGGLPRRSPSSRRAEAGFTLVEMMVVIVIIGVLAAVMIKQISGRADKAKAAATRVMIKNVGDALDLFKLDHNVYPESLDDVVYMPSYVNSRDWPPGGYLKKAPRDGWSNEFIFRIPGTAGQPFDIISYGEDGRQGGEGLAEDIWNHDSYDR